jgi:hypothetical protein
MRILFEMKMQFDFFLLDRIKNLEPHLALSNLQQVSSHDLILHAQKSETWKCTAKKLVKSHEIEDFN